MILAATNLERNYTVADCNSLKTLNILVNSYLFLASESARSTNSFETCIASIREEPKPGPAIRPDSQ